MEHLGNIRALYIIVNAGFAGDIVTIAREAGARGATIINARGETASHAAIMGITVDSEKEIVLCVVDKELVEKITTAIKEKAGYETPAHSVCFVIPIEQVTGLPIPEAASKQAE